MKAPSLLRAENLIVARGGVPVLDIPSLTLESGSVLALIGPNGSGKTTLLQTLACLQRPRSGTLAFRGDILGPRPQAYRRRVTMVFQTPLLFDASVRANLESGLRLHGVPAAERSVRVGEAAGRFGLDGLLDRPARNLSGGEAQRTSLARAFALRPEILFLDEPFSALDPPTREALLDDLAAILQETRTTTVLATHDQMEALRLADQLAVMHRGRIVQAGAAREVFNAPADAFVAGFVGMETLLSGTVCACGPGEFRVAAGGREVAVLGEARLGEEVRLGIRPEHITLGDGPPNGLANRYPCTVIRLVPRGPFLKVNLDCGFPLAAYATLSSAEDLGLRAGCPVTASFRAASVHVLRS